MMEIDKAEGGYDEGCMQNESAANKILEEVNQCGPPAPIRRIDAFVRTPREEPLLPLQLWDSERVPLSSVPKVLTPETRTAVDKLNSSEVGGPKLLSMTPDERIEFRRVAKDLESDVPEVREAALAKLLSAKRELYLPAMLELRQEASDARRNQAAGKPTDIKDPADLVLQCDRFLSGHVQRAFDVKSPSEFTGYLLDRHAGEAFAGKGPREEEDSPDSPRFFKPRIPDQTDQDVSRRIERIATLDQDKDGDLQMMRLLCEKAPDLLSSERRVLLAPVHERIRLARDIARQDPGSALALVKQAVQRDSRSCAGALASDFVAVCGKLDLSKEPELRKLLEEAERNLPKPDFQKIIP